MNWRGLLYNEALRASFILILLLNIVFFPAVWGNKTLLLSAWDSSSVMPRGAYGPPLHEGPSKPNMPRVLDAGAAAWLSEPLYKVLSDQLWKDHTNPLWNPYSSYGTPLAAGMSPQPYFPLTVLLSLHPTPWTYNLFLISRLLVAGLLAFFFARLFLPFRPSLFAATGFMLTGYFILQIGMSHISVDALLPGIFLVFELLLRKDSWSAVALTAMFIAVAVLGGMPESLFLMLAFGCFYYVFRLATNPEFQTRLWPRLARFVAAIALGFALSSFLLLPFFEYVPISANTHTPGAGKSHGPVSDTDIRGLILYFLPTFGGPIGRPIFEGSIMRLWGYWGLLPSIFALSAILCSLLPKRNNISQPLQALSLFFSVSLSLLLLKQFGSPIINWIGYLPVFEQIDYIKYDAPLMGFCVAILAGIGFAQITEGRTAPAFFFGATGVLVTSLIVLAASCPPAVIGHKDSYLAYYAMPIAAGIATLGAIFLFFLPARMRNGVAWGLFGLMSAELFFNFVFPTFYWFNSLPPASLNPYAGAPYIDFLRAKNKDHYRVFGREGVLFPEWSGAFGIADVRGLDALYFGRYMEFVRGFLLPHGSRWPRRFTGVDRNAAYAFHTEAERRFLALSSVKYVISVTQSGITGIANGIFTQHRAEKIPGFGPSTFVVNGKKRSALSQPPPSNRVSFNTTIDPRAPVFEGTAALRDDAKGDGAGFRIEIDAGGEIETLFSTTVNPAVEADRSGHPFRIDLGRYAGEKVTLLFSTDHGPEGDKNSDFAGWLELRFAAAENTSRPLVQVYDEEVTIKEVPDALPRAALFRTVEVLPDEKVIERLKDPAFDPSTTIILSRESLAAEDAAALKAVAPVSVTEGDTAKISTYEPLRVAIDVTTKAPAVLMLNDANYPGWNAYIDGKRTPVFKADYLFRAAVVPAGKSTVVFAYEPLSFRLGVLCSILALCVLAVPLLWRGGRRRSVERTPSMC